MQSFWLVTQRPSQICETMAMFTPYPISVSSATQLHSYTAGVNSVVTGGALRDDAKNGCVAD